MLSIAITGNFGMGKTTVMKIFKRLGAVTFDSDRIVHEILKSTVVIGKIEKRFGSGVIKNRKGESYVDKRALASIIFKNAKLRRSLEAVIHPRVFIEINKIKTAFRKSENTILIFEIPLLFEGDYQKYFDRTIVVYSKRHIAFQRLESQGLSRAEIKDRYNAQLPISHKKEKADFLIDNSDSLALTEKRVRRVFSKLKMIEQHQN